MIFNTLEFYSKLFNHIGFVSNYVDGIKMCPPIPPPSRFLV